MIILSNDINGQWPLHTELGSAGEASSRSNADRSAGDRRHDRQPIADSAGQALARSAYHLAQVESH